MENKVFIFTEAYDCGLILKKCLESFFKYHPDVIVNIFGTAKDFKEVGKSFTLNKEVWAKATTDAMKNGKDPAIVVVIGEGNSKVRLAIIEMSILEDLVEE